MVVIARRWRLALLIAFAVPLHADRAADMLRVVNYMATALSDDNAADAMTVVETSFKDYDKLSGSLQALTDRAYLFNQVSVIDETDSPTETKLTVQWILSIKDRNDPANTEQRTRELHLRLILDKDKWRIADIGPIDLFDPRPAKPLK